MAEFPAHCGSSTRRIWCTTTVGGHKKALAKTDPTYLVVDTKAGETKNLGDELGVLLLCLDRVFNLFPQRLQGAAAVLVKDSSYLMLGVYRQQGWF